MPLVEKQPLLMSKERVLFLPLHYVWDRRPSSHLDKMSTPWNISPLVVYRKDMNHFVCKYTLLGQLKMDSYNLPKRILIPLCSSWFWVFHYGVGPIHIIFFYHSNRHLQSLITQSSVRLCHGSLSHEFIPQHLKYNKCFSFGLSAFFGSTKNT